MTCPPPSPFSAAPTSATFLASLGEFRTAETLSPAQSALLRALEHAGLVEILAPEEWQARSGAERAEAARRAEEESRREAARVALEAARAAEERRQAEMRGRADAARRALEAAKAAEAAWRRAREGNGEPGGPGVHGTEREFPAAPPPVRTTEVEFHALSEDMPPLEPPVAPAPVLEGDEPMVPVLTRSTLAPFEAPVPSTDPMGLPPSADEPGRRGHAGARHGAGARAHRPVRPDAPAARSRAGSPPPPPTRSGTDPYAQGLEVEPGQTDPYAQPLARPDAPPASDELPTPPAQPFVFPAAATPTPPRGTTEARTPPGGIVVEPEELVLEPEALLLSDADSAPTPAAGTLVEDMSEALRRAGLEASPELWQSPSTEAVGSKHAERSPLRLGPESAEADADLWKLVNPEPTGQPGSFEAALRQVDGQLETLAGLRGAPVDPDNPGTVPMATSDLDALVKASFESGEWTLGTAASENSGRIALAALSGTPVPAPLPPSGDQPALSAERRQELLRQARATAEREPVSSIPTPPPRSLEDAELAEAIEARHASLTRDPDRFSVLGLSPGAGATT